MSGITVKELRVICDNLVKTGHGDKEVLISQDDEGNGFHTLWGEVYCDVEDVRQIAEYTYFHDRNDPATVVLFS